MTDVNKENYPQPILVEDLGMMLHTESSKGKTRFGLYKCGLCGEEFKANTYNINRGHTKSCGCYHKRRTVETHKTHGLGYTRLYNIWNNIKNRTLNPKDKRYNYYGGRGITICDEWKNDVKSFYDWSILNGYEENKSLSIDRIDNDGNYCPENCRWVTQTIQNRNRRIRTNNTSGYKGVRYRKDNNKYRAGIVINKKSVNLGSYPTAVEGAIAYNNYIIENNLEGFILNEISQKHLEKEITNEKTN